MSTAPATHPPAAAGSTRPIKDLLEASQDRLAAVLPRHMTPAKCAQVVATLAYKNPKLRECEPATVLSAVIEACELGLDLSPGMNEGYLIPRWNNKARRLECHFQPSYQGLAKLARQSGQVAYLSSRLVRARDVFALCYRPDLDFVHTPHVGPDPGAVTHVYAVAKLAMGDYEIAVLTVDEVEAVRRRSQSTDGGPWSTDWNEMARKTAMKRLCKALPRSVELARAVAADDAEYEGGYSVVSASPARPARGAAALASRLGVSLPAPVEDLPDAEPPEEPSFAPGTVTQVYSEAEPAEAPPPDDPAPVEAAHRSRRRAAGERPQEGPQEAAGPRQREAGED